MRSGLVLTVIKDPVVRHIRAGRYKVTLRFRAHGAQMRTTRVGRVP
jgi:hypothetical protein